MLSTDFENIFEQLPQAVYILDKDGRFIRVNKGAEEMYGYPKAFFRGKTPEALSPPGKNDLNQVAAYHKRAFEGEKVEFSFYGLRQNGEIFPKKVTLMPGTYRGSRVVIAIGQDLSDMKQYEESLINTEERYRTLFHFSPVGMTLIDKNGIILDVNDTFCSNMGYRRNELIGQNIRIVVTDEFQDMVESNIKRILDGETLKSTHQSKRKDGGIENILLSERRIKLPDGEYGILSVSNFITDKVKVQQALKESEQTYRNLTELSPNAIIVHSGGKFVFVNRAAVEIIGANSKEDLLGMPILSVMHPDSVEFAKERILQMMKTKQPLPPAEEKLLRLDGKTIITEITAAPITYNGKEAYITVIRDITKEKEVLKQLTEAKNKAEESDKLKSAFIQNMSHEIRTPLNAIIGFSDLLRNPQVLNNPDEAARFGEMIRANGQRLLDLLSNILDVAQLQSGTLKVNEHTFNLNKLLKELYNYFRSQADSKNIELILRMELPEEESFILADAPKLKQILTHLLDNALKFTSKGKIIYGYKTINEKIEFYVSDTGRGIAPEHFKKIFDRFYQIDTSFSKDFEGAGLGLSIVKGNTDLLDGEITVHSKLGEGTTFTVTIPYHKSSFTVNDEKFLTQRKGKEIVLLVADDDNSSAYLIKAMLKNQNVKLLYADNGIEAIEIIKKHPETDLVLMDIKMAGMSGLEATKKIKQMYPHLPVIATTAYAYPSEMEMITDAGCDAIVTKPILKKELFSVLYKVCKKF